MFGKTEFVRRFTGPVKLRKADDCWRVADYRIDGRSRARSCFDASRGQVEREGLTVTAAAADLRAKSTVVYLFIENARDRPVRFFEAGLIAPWELVDGGVREGVDVQAGDRIQTAALFPRASSPWTRKLRMVLLARKIQDGVPMDPPLRLVLEVRLGRKAG